MSRLKVCYICYKNKTDNMLDEVPVCELCMKLHFRDELEKREKESIELKEAIELQEPINLDLKLNWDGEDTQPLWASFLNNEEED